MPTLTLIGALAGVALAGPKTFSPALVIPASIRAAAMPDRRYVFGLKVEGGVVVWSALTGKLIAEASGQGAAIDQKTGIAIIGSEIWDLEQGKRIFDAGGGGVFAGISPDGKYAVTGRDEIQIWNLKMNAVIGRIRAGRPTFIAFSEDPLLIAIGRGPQFEIYDLGKGELLRSGALAGVWPFRLKPTKGFDEVVGGRAVAFSVIYEDGNPSSGAQAQTLWAIDWESKPVDIFGMSRTGGQGLGARPSGNDVVLYLAADPSVEHLRLVGHQARIKRVSFSPDHWTFATGDVQGEVRVWDTFNGEQLSQFTFGSGPIKALNFSPDSQFLMAANGSEIRIYTISP